MYFELKNYIWWESVIVFYDLNVFYFWGDQIIQLGQFHKYLIERTEERTHKRLDERTEELTDELTDERTDGQTDEQMDEPTDS